MHRALFTYLFWVMIGTLTVRGSQSSTSAAQQLDCFNSETAAINQSNWQETLGRWRTDLQNAACFNPASAFAFIEAMNNYESEQYYTVAERFYFKALNASYNSNNFGLLRKEAQKIMPLLSPSVQKRWKAKIKQRNASLKNDVKTFWVRRDPVLTTATNERLREHWQRISYARRHFTRNTDSVYQTDDRGEIYIRLGPPTSVESGRLTPEPTEIRSKLYDISSFKGAMSSEEMFRLNMAIRQHYMPQKYEIWIYEDLRSARPHRIPFIFGASGSSGNFGLRKSVEEFIPASTFNASIGRSWRHDTGPRGLTAGPFLQAALYSTLSTVDNYFGQQLLNYDSHWNDYLSGEVNFAGMNMQNNRMQAEMALRRLQDRAPNSYSTLTQNLASLNHSHLTYRFLNARFEPVYKILVFAQPAKDLLKHDARLNPKPIPAYRIDNMLKITDTDTSILHHNLAGIIDSMKSAGYMLKIPDAAFKDSSQIVQLGSEIKRFTKSPEDGKYHVVIIASDVSELTPPAPLYPGDRTFMVSDLIWGYGPAAKNHNIENISFAVPGDGTILYGKNLNLYFEAYHLQPTPNSLYTYQLEYEIKRISKQKLIDRGIKLNLSFETRATRSRESLEINTSQLEPGRYRGFFRFGKKTAPKTAWVERIIDFRIVR